MVGTGRIGPGAFRYRRPRPRLSPRSAHGSHVSDDRARGGESLKLAATSRWSAGTMLRRRAMQISVAAATVLASLAVAGPASAWPMCGW